MCTTQQKTNKTASIRLLIFFVTLLSSGLPSLAQVSFYNSLGETIEINACSDQYWVTIDMPAACTLISIDSDPNDIIDLGSLEISEGTARYDLQNLCSLISNSDLQFTYSTCGTSQVVNDPPAFSPLIWSLSPPILEQGVSAVSGVQALYLPPSGQLLNRQTQISLTAYSQIDGLYLDYSESDSEISPEFVEILDEQGFVLGSASVSNLVADLDIPGVEGSLTVKEYFGIGACGEFTFSSTISANCSNGSEICLEQTIASQISIAEPFAPFSNSLRKIAEDDNDNAVGLCSEGEFGIEICIKNGNGQSSFPDEASIKQIERIEIPVDLSHYTMGVYGILNNSYMVHEDGTEVPLLLVEDLDVNYEYQIRSLTLEPEANFKTGASPFVSWYSPSVKDCLTKGTEFCIEIRNLTFDTDGPNMYLWEDSQSCSIGEMLAGETYYSLFGNREGSLSIKYHSMCNQGLVYEDNELNFGTNENSSLTDVSLPDSDISCGDAPRLISSTITIPQDQSAWTFRNNHSNYNENDFYFFDCPDSQYMIEFEVGHFLELESTDVMVNGQIQTAVLDRTESFNYSAAGYEASPCETIEYNCQNDIFDDIIGVTEIYRVAVPTGVSLVELEVYLSLVTQASPNGNLDDVCRISAGPQQYDDLSHFKATLIGTCDNSCPELLLPLSSDEVKIFWHCCGPCEPVACDLEEPPSQNHGYGHGTLDMELYRITPGWTDESMTTLVELEPESTDYRIDRVYEGDKVVLKANGLMMATTTHIESIYYELSYINPQQLDGELPMQLFEHIPYEENPESILEMRFSEVTVPGVQTCGPSWFSIPSPTNPPAFVMDNGEVYVKTIPLDLTSGDDDCLDCRLRFVLPMDEPLGIPGAPVGMTLGDIFTQDQSLLQTPGGKNYVASLSLSTEFKIRELPENYDRVLSFDPMIRGDFMTIQEQILPNEQAVVLAPKPSCDTWGAHLEILNPEVEIRQQFTFPRFYPEFCIMEEGGTCDVQYYSEIRIKQALPGMDEFPNEFRPVVESDLFVVAVNNGVVKSIGYNLQAEGCNYVPGLVYNSAPVASMDLSGSKAMLEASGIPDRIMFAGTLERRCQTGDLLAIMSLKYQEGNQITLTDDSNSVFQYSQHLDDFPIPDVMQISPEISLDSSSGETVFSLEAIYATTYLDMENFWIKISTENGLGIDEVSLFETESGTTIQMVPDDFDSQTYYPDNGQSWNKNEVYEIRFQLAEGVEICAAEQVVVEIGFGCNGDCQSWSSEVTLDPAVEVFAVEGLPLSYDQSNACETVVLDLFLTNLGDQDLYEFTINQMIPQGLELIKVAHNNTLLNFSGENSTTVDYFDNPSLFPIGSGETIDLQLIYQGSCALYGTEQDLQVSISPFACGTFNTAIYGNAVHSTSLQFEPFNSLTNFCTDCEMSCSDRLQLSTNICEIQIEAIIDMSEYCERYELLISAENLDTGELVTWTENGTSVDGLFTASYVAPLAGKYSITISEIRCIDASGNVLGTCPYLKDSVVVNSSCRPGYCHKIFTPHPLDMDNNRAVDLSYQGYDQVLAANLCGGTQSDIDPYYCRYNPNHEEQYAYTLDKQNSQESIEDFLVVGSKQYAIGQIYIPSKSGFDIVITCQSKEGDLLWQRLYDFSDSDQGFKLLQSLTEEANLIAFANTAEWEDKQIIVFEIDGEDGSIVSDIRSIGKEVRDEIGADAVAFNAYDRKGYIVVGKQSHQDSHDLTLTILDKQLQLLVSRRYRNGNASVEPAAIDLGPVRDNEEITQFFVVSKAETGSYTKPSLLFSEFRFSDTALDGRHMLIEGSNLAAGFIPRDIAQNERSHLVIVGEYQYRSIKEGALLVVDDDFDRSENAYPVEGCYTTHRRDYKLQSFESVDIRFDGRIGISGQEFANGNTDLSIVETNLQGQSCCLYPVRYNTESLAFIESELPARLGTLYDEGYESFPEDYENRTEICKVYKNRDSELAPVAEGAALLEATASPNPSNSNFRVELSDNSEAIKQISVWDSTGRMLEVYTPGSSGHEHNMDAAKWPEGLYFYQVLTNSGIQVNGNIMIMR